MSESWSIQMTFVSKFYFERDDNIWFYSKVMSVVKEQITKTLKTQPPTLDKFETKVLALTYKDITELWLNERRNVEEQEMKAPQIRLAFSSFFLWKNSDLVESFNFLVTLGLL